MEKNALVRCNSVSLTSLAHQLFIASQTRLNGSPSAFYSPKQNCRLCEDRLFICEGLVKIMLVGHNKYGFGDILEQEHLECFVCHVK